MSNLLNVALIGRNSIVREGLARILLERGFRIAASVENIPLFIEAVEAKAVPEVDLVVVEVAAGSSATSVSSVLASCPTARVVLLAEQFDLAQVHAAFQEGAYGYLVQDILLEPMIASLKLAATGEKVLPSQIADHLTLEPAKRASVDEQHALVRAQLSDREIEILRCLVMGCPNKIISRELGVTEATVKVHVKSILRKVRVANRTQAAIWGANRGISAIKQAPAEIEPELASPVLLLA